MKKYAKNLGKFETRFAQTPNFPIRFHISFMSRQFENDIPLFQYGKTTYKMKMYILIKRNIPDKLVPVICAHASLACFRKFEQDPDMQTWINEIFKKVICTVDDALFEKMKEVPKHLILTESALDNQEVCIVFCPREEYPKAFKFFSMWKPMGN